MSLTAKCCRSVMAFRPNIFYPRRSCVLFSTSVSPADEGTAGSGSQKRRRRRQKKAAWTDDLSWEERLADAVTPLWRLSYEEQLELKQSNHRRILSELSGSLSPDLRSALPAPASAKLNFPVLPVLPSPVRDGYRNKSTFSVNRGVDGNPKTVGFYLGTASRGNIVCVNGDHLLNMPEKHTLVARCYQDFIRQSSLEPCLLFHTGGHWREVTVLGFKFRISADAFFQVNQAAAQVLYNTVRDLCVPGGAQSKTGSTLLDVCCGTGAIGIISSPRVDRVIGVEIIEQAVRDAAHNAALNNVENCEFLPGKAEVVLPALMSQLSSAPGVLTAVVNPSRAGLHPKVVRALRNQDAIRRLVYVSCKPDGEAMRNFKELCCAPNQEKKLTGDAFSPTLAVPVDMFPHTPHCELVLLFER
ncbi:tRNA (uracil(54)-C(5))-methyltransferase homolog isoform X2 [Xiphophorus maculatus]|uniref:tRNA (uracil(54)-C(5))-methyltransferase homolog isoform X2 n=1 Tax=Xiphophorus maculatus TaxID=8083 RepID=UPI000C6EB140|nr:tRNA (uracil(54)-C(5))-methyltransferase homolog isoform X2 [Xiphophorus maculatus]